MVKDHGAFLTIGELAGELGVAQHILRYWESRFPQLRPLQRSGNRRYYRPADVEIARRIHRLLNDDGFTVRGAQRVLADRKTTRPDVELAAAPAQTPAPVHPSRMARGDTSDRQRELPINGPSSRSASGGSTPANGLSSGDMEALIGRLTRIREDLRDAIEPD